MQEVKNQVKKMKEEMRSFDYFMDQNNQKHQELVKYSNKLEECLNQLKSDYRKITELTSNQH